MAEENPTYLEGKDDNEKLDKLITYTYKQQAVWFLNAFWENLFEHSDADRELVWDWERKMADLDLEKRETGNGLDELNAHRFLEHFP